MHESPPFPPKYTGTEGVSLNLFWNFIYYSFFGFLLEVAFARLTRAEKQDRKCFWLLPLCPVYGLGALAILALPEGVKASPLALALWGGLAATGVEYVMAVFYEKCLGVAFWDYSPVPGNLQGRVCLLFSLFWGLLSLALVGWVHPVISAIPEPPVLVTATALGLVAFDGLYTVLLLRRTRDTRSLRWYKPRKEKASQA